ARVREPVSVHGRGVVAFVSRRGLPAPSPVYGGRLGRGPAPKAGGIHCRARFAPTPALPRKRGRELSALSRQRTELSAVPRERWKGSSVLSCMREGVICSFPRLRGKVGMGAGTEGGGRPLPRPRSGPGRPPPAPGPGEASDQPQLGRAAWRGPLASAGGGAAPADTGGGGGSCLPFPASGRSCLPFPASGGRGGLSSPVCGKGSSAPSPVSAEEAAFLPCRGWMPGVALAAGQAAAARALRPDQAKPATST